MSFTPTSTSGLQSVLTLTGRPTQAPVSLSIAVGDEYPQPYPYYLPCSFYYSSAGGGLAWTNEAEGSAAYITNYSCAVTLNSIDYNPSTGNRTLNVTVSYYSSIWGTQPIKARVSSPSGVTNWTTVGTWIP